MAEDRLIMKQPFHGLLDMVVYGHPLRAGVDPAIGSLVVWFVADDDYTSHVFLRKTGEAYPSYRLYLNSFEKEHPDGGITVYHAFRSLLRRTHPPTEVEPPILPPALNAILRKSNRTATDE